MNPLNQQHSLLVRREGPMVALAYVYFIIFLLLLAFYSQSPFIWLTLAVLAVIFILPNHYYLALPLIVSMTMLFERFFTLQGLVIDRYIYKLYPIDIVMMLGFLALAVDLKLTKRKIKLAFGWPEGILIAFMVLVAGYFIRAIFDVNADIAVAFSSFKNYFWYPLIYFFVLFTVQTGKDLKKISHLILISGAGIIAFLLVGLARGGGLWTEYTPLSTSGTRYLAGTHAFYLVLSLMLGVSLLAFKRLRSIGFATMIAIFWVLGISLSLMRHLWLDAVFSLSLLFLLLPRPNQKELYKYVSKATLGLATIFALLALSAGLFYLSGFSESFREQAGNLIVRGTSLLDLGEDTSATWRLQLWYDAREAWNKNRFFGLGFGKTILIDTGDWQNFEEVRNMHNSMLALLVQMGFLGFSFFAALVAVSGFYAIKRIYQNEELTPYYLGISAGCATFLFASLFQPYLETNLMGIFFWIFLGLLRTSAIINKDEDTANQ